MHRNRIHNRIGRNIEQGMPSEQAEHEAQQWARRMRIIERSHEKEETSNPPKADDVIKGTPD